MRRWSLAVAGAAFCLGMAVSGTGPRAQGVPLPSAAEPTPDVPQLDIPTFGDLEFAIALPSSGALPPELLAERIFLRRVALRGVSVYDPAALEALFPEPLPGDVRIADIYAFEAAVSRRYREDGYGLSFAIVPPQEISDGVIVVEAIEGFVDSVRLDESLEGQLRATIGDLLAPVSAQRPMRVATLESAMLRINALPGVTARGVLRPAESQTKGATDLILDVSRERFAARASFDNRGTEYAGYLRTRGGVDILSPGDLPISVSASWNAVVPTDEGTGYALSGAYALPDGATQVTAAYASSRANLGGRLREDPPGGFGLDFRTETESITFGVERSLVSLRRHALSAGAQIERSRVLSTESKERNYHDRLTVAQADLTYRYRDLPAAGGDGVIRLSARHGIDALGASTEGAPGGVSRLDGEVDFTRFNIEFSHRWDLGRGVSLDLRGAGQRATTHLLSGEEFALGGERFGRAYDGGEIRGEHGVAGAVEIAKTVRFDPEWAPLVRLYGFYEIGRVWDDDQSAAGGDRSIATAGFGARLAARPLKDGPEISLFGEKATPLTRQPERIYGDGLRSRYSFGAGISFSLEEK